MSQLRSQFENHPRFRGMDFTRDSGHPEYYVSPYANGAWDGYQAGVSSAPKGEYCERDGGCLCGGDTEGVRRTCGNWVRA